MGTRNAQGAGLCGCRRQREDGSEPDRCRATGTARAVCDYPGIRCSRPQDASDRCIGRRDHHRLRCVRQRGQDHRPARQ